MRRWTIAIVSLALLAWGLSLDVRAAHSDHGCNNCHVPHRAAADEWGVPLWSTNQTEDGLTTFTLYSSQGFDALETDIGQPDGASKQCLGCHDGTYAAFDFLGDAHVFGAEDLATSHPVSFTYDTALADKVTNGGLLDPATAMSGLGGTVEQDLLDERGKMQCTSCHDVHLTGKGDYALKYDWYPETIRDSNGEVIVSQNDQDMCRVCHNK